MIKLIEMIIDSHQHFWKYNKEIHSWIDDSMSVIRRDFLPADLKETFQQNKVVGCVAVQADSTEQETNFLLHLAKENSFIKGVVGWVDLLAENLEERLEHFSQNKNFKGIRHILQAETQDFILREDFQKGISKLAKFNLTYDILIFPPQIKNTVEMVGKFPQQKFVLDHLAKPYIKKAEIKQWETDISELAKLSNVHCKISGMVTEHNFHSWNKEDFFPYLDVIVENFGIDRILFGSDWPVCLVAANYSQVLEIVTDYFRQFSKEEQEKFFAKNCLDFYSL